MSRSDVGTLGSNEHRVQIMTYGLFSSTSTVARYVAENPFNVVILDESHAIKSRTAQRTKLLTPILTQAKRAILLTGTPALGRPAELYVRARTPWPVTVGFWNSSLVMPL